MKIEKWNICLDNKEYMIEFYPSVLFKFVFQLIINDEVYKKLKYKLHRKGAEYNFEINGHRAAIVLKVERFRPSYELLVDGVAISQEQES